MSEFQVEVAPIKTGRSVTHVELRWTRKDAPKQAEAERELSFSKVGRKARITGEAEVVRPRPPNAELTHKAKIADIWDKGKHALVVTEADHGRFMAMPKEGAGAGTTTSFEVVSGVASTAGSAMPRVRASDPVRGSPNARPSSTLSGASSGSPMRAMVARRSAELK